MQQPPVYLTQFAHLLVEGCQEQYSLRLGEKEIHAQRGISERIMYAHEPWQLLGNHVEYVVGLPTGSIPMSLQLYENVSSHFRLFLYTSRSKMLLSVNFTTANVEGNALALEQQMKIITQSLSADERRSNRDQLIGCLQSEGFTMIEGGWLALGFYDRKAGRFVDTEPSRFVEDFLRAGLIKGHYMANKGYVLDWIGERSGVDYARMVADPEKELQRQPSLVLRYQVMERDNGRCLLCGRSATDGLRLHVDHVVPFSMGGKTTLDNLQTLCEECNRGKGNRSSHRFG